uniref:Uncharacterized protein n=1 Tax=Glossina palpalis gambiensis TaxID=67801 RepID=A0A1B0BP52_9MUSC
MWIFGHKHDLYFSKTIKTFFTPNYNQSVVELGSLPSFIDSFSKYMTKRVKLLDDDPPFQTVFKISTSPYIGKKNVVEDVPMASVLSAICLVWTYFDFILFLQSHQSVIFYVEDPRKIARNSSMNNENGILYDVINPVKIQADELHPRTSKQ